MTFSRRTMLAGLAGASTLAPLPSFAAPPPRGLISLKNRRPMLDISVRSGDGDEVEFRDLKGQPVIFVFWATWCGICHGEMPKLNELKADLGADVHVIPLSTDREGMARVSPYFERRDLDALIPYVDREGVVASMMRVRGVPTAFVIDAQGRVAAIGQGRIDWGSSAARTYIASLS